MEHLRLSWGVAGVTGNGLVIGTGEDGRPFRAHYTVRCEAAWRVRSLRVTVPGDPNTYLHLHSDGDGNWATDAGTPLPDLTGCVDVDFRATPFTNTLPIRRLELSVGESADIDVAWVDAPSFAVTAERQRYTCLDRTAEGGRYRFESLDGGGFVAELPTDADGLVRDYPGLFRRVPGG